MHRLQENTHPRSLTQKTAVIAGAIAVAVALLDGGFKFLAIHNLPSDNLPMSWPVALALHKNPGIIFDIAVPLFVILPMTLVLCVVLLIIAKKNLPSSTHQSVALWWIVCGAVGNAIDRVANHFTTDYIIFFRRSAINLSDILIIIGALLYLYYSESKLPEGTTH